jgi:ribulose-phosphate 3-epimerase
MNIYPSLLAMDMAYFAEEIAALEKAGADGLHVDVMDGKFVPNLTFGPPVIKALRRCTGLPLDVHLMIEEPERSVDQYIEAGANGITVHVESTVHLDRLCRHLRSAGVQVGVALVPTTSPNALDYVGDLIDRVLVMTVNPGFGGQSFLDSQLAKIAVIRDWIALQSQAIDLQVDGGVNNVSAPLLAACGVTTLVAGSYITQQGRAAYANRIASLRGVD